MRILEKNKNINIHIEGEGVDQIIDLIRDNIPEVDIKSDEDDEELVEWNSTDLAKEIRTKKTPGKLLQAYRLREGLTLVQLAEKIGTKYPNLSAMENDRRTIGLAMAKKLGQVLNVDFEKFIVE
ncbi:MAG: helix-turn-helix transcriptional regulator [Spirochaetia bacterium]